MRVSISFGHAEQVDYTAQFALSRTFVLGLGRAVVTSFDKALVIVEKRRERTKDLHDVAIDGLL